ncbi:MAG: hypothetical protein RL380_1191, partial [Verrucomicrobiota bacterium]
MKTTSLLRVALITLIAAFTAHVRAAVVSWNGAAQTNVAIPWSTAGNWGGGTAPVAADDVKFFDAGAVAGTSNVNNTVDADRTISSLFYSQTNNNHTTFITNGATLNVTNSAGAAFGNVIFLVGLTNDHTAVKTNYTTIAGPGTLYVSNTAAYIVTAQGQNAANASRAVLDMSGLDTFNGNVRAWGVSSINHFFANVAQRLGAYVYLAKTNTVKLNLTDTLANLSTLGSRTNALEIGFFSAANNGSVQNWFYLGKTNAFFVDSIGIGRSKSSTSSAATLTFNPAFTNTSPVAYFRGINGGVNRVIWWAVGDMADNASSAQQAVGTNDFSNGTLDAMVDTMSLGRDCSASHTATGNNIGAFHFTAGTLDVNTLILGNQALGPITSLSGNIGHMNVNGSSAVLKVNTTVAMASTVAASGNHAIRTLGQFTIRNGGTASINTLTCGALSTNTGFILMTNLGTLNITNVAGSLTRGITTFNTTNSTLGFVINPGTNNNFVATNINSGGGSNVIKILAAGVYSSYPTQVTLIKAQGTFIGSNLFVLNSTLPGSTPGASLVANPANNSLDLLLPTDPRPVITGQPAGFSGSAGGNVNLTVTNTGVAPLTYQWRRSGTNISNTGNWSGTTTTNLLISGSLESDSGDYTVVITNSYGSVTSSVTTVTISSGSPVAPAITGPTPSAQSVVATSNITFTTSVSGYPSPSLQWQKDGVDVTGSNANTFTITGAQYPADQATYSLIASNVAGIVTNSVALTVYVFPAITTQPTNL